MADDEPKRSCRSIVVICTRNRHDDLVRALAWTQESSPGIPMLVADASDPGEAARVRRVASGHEMCTFLECAPGLARQRNQALAWIRSQPEKYDIVHFIDDDSEPLPGYFDAIEAAFQANPDVGGVGGIGLGLPLPRFQLLKSRLHLSSPKAGRVLPSGRSTMAYYAEWVPTHPQRLSGFAMSYRMSAIEHLAFDNRLEGYSYGEDLLFSFALSHSCPLLVEPKAHVRHHLSPTNRHSRAKVARAAVPLQHRFVRENRAHGLRLSAFWFSVISDIVSRSLLGVLTADGDSLAMAQGVARGAFDTLRHPLAVQPPDR